MEPILIPTNADDTKRRLKRFREGCRMSRREFGVVDRVLKVGDAVGIYTDRHSIYIPFELWEELGSVGEEAVQGHKVTSSPVM